MVLRFSGYPQKNIIISCAVNILRNMVRGYTVEYPTAGASLLQEELAYASAGGSVYEPAIIPIMVK